ncbi:N-formylglutamate amidohydrolase [Saccharibacter sp. 17.LH.SD]|uniref:N-formylglutamate amidohydrolase n=1 Tax=Saccharibacter sp. 17.LH.SD TaxID=2689393 RepID=UPI00137185C8|nr:N-formylglutamate amidohydrolase [Saccharibacter sp. 17.LH.SD]MXV44547.1 N-formylglutamate amidohydrolase [Saccharibacter sp. 17.LH.SD]
MAASLLGQADPVPYRYWPAKKESPFLLVSDHAGRETPEQLGFMGIPSHEWERHIAYDIGIKKVGHHLRDCLGCALIEQVYSRLVIDSNRAPGHATSIPAVSDATPIPANEGLTAEQRRRREEEILHPYHDKIEELVKERAGQEMLFVSLHSFTPAMADGSPRPWQIGLLHDHDKETAHLMRSLLLEDDPSLHVGDNEPYILNRANEYTVPYHAASRHLPALEIEIRQDLITDETGQREWGERLARLLPRLWVAKRG